MSFDRNKSELTHNITRLASLWMDGKGFKPVETEVGVAPGWSADLAGVCCPTQTEAIELKLIPRAPRSRAVSADFYHDAIKLWRDKLNAIPFPLTALIEVKISVGDYSGDRKWTAPWPTNLCYVAMPEGMIDPMKWPKGWGVILFSQEGTTIRKVYAPTELRPMTHEQQLATVLAIAVRRDNNTRYAKLRELQKKIRIEEGEGKTVHRFSCAIRVVRAIMAGKPIDEALLHHGIRTKLPSHVMDDLLTLSPSKQPAMEVEV